MAPSAVPVEVSGGTILQSKNSNGENESIFVPDETSGPPTFADKHRERAYLKHRLVLAFRIFAKFGLSEGVAGHITLRDPVEPNSFWVNPFGLHFSVIEDEDLIRVDERGEVVEGGRCRRLNYAAFAIHHAIHLSRPDVLCAAHSHSIHGRAFCATGRTLSMLNQDTCIFYNDHILYPSFSGVVLAPVEGASIASALGHRKAALLGSHGLLTAGPSIEAAVAWFVMLENCCRVQLLADASSAGSGEKLVEIGEEEARGTWETLGSGASGYFNGLPLFQVAERELGERTYLGRGLEPV